MRGYSIICVDLSQLKWPKKMLSCYNTTTSKVFNQCPKAILELSKIDKRSDTTKCAIGQNKLIKKHRQGHWVFRSARRCGQVFPNMGNKGIQYTPLGRNKRLNLFCYC